MSFMGNLQPDDYGWALDSEGIPEMWMWVGHVGNECLPQEWDDVNSNKLILLKCDPVDNKVKIKHDFGQIFDFNILKSYGNLVWVSRNVFLITLLTDNAAGNYGVAKSVVHACLLKENGSTNPNNWTITTSVWKREILKEGTYGEGNNFPTDKTRYPGVPSGMTVMPSMSRPARDWAQNGVIEKNILTITGSWPYWGVVYGDNNHVVRVHRMSSIPEGVGNGIREDSDSYYADGNAWEDGSDGSNTKISAWTSVRNWGNPEYAGGDVCGTEVSFEPESKNDHKEGWCSCDSKGNFYYGNFTHWTGSDPLTWEEYCAVGCNDCPGWLHVGGIAKVDGENGLSDSSTRTKLMFNRDGSQGNGWSGLGAPPGNWEDAGQNLNNPGIPYKISEYTTGDIHDQSHNLNPDGGAFDIYGQTKSLLPGDTNYNSKDALFLLRQPNQDGGRPKTNEEREGIWIVKEKTQNSPVMQVLKRYSCYHQVSDSALDDGGNGGWSSVGMHHDADMDDNCADARALHVGLSFRPNSYK